MFVVSLQFEVIHKVIGDNKTKNRNHFSIINYVSVLTHIHSYLYICIYCIYIYIYLLVCLFVCLYLIYNFFMPKWLLPIGKLVYRANFQLPSLVSAQSVNIMPFRHFLGAPASAGECSTILIYSIRIFLMNVRMHVRVRCISFGAHRAIRLSPLILRCVLLLK